MTRKTGQIKGTLVQAYIVTDETFPMSLIQFEPPIALLSFIKITIILQLAATCFGPHWPITGSTQLYTIGA